MTELPGFTAKQAAFVVEYAQSGNVTKASAAAGVARGTAYNWLAKREIMDAIQQMRDNAISNAWSSLSAGLQGAVDTVRGVLVSDVTTTNNKLRAAELIISQVQILTENREIVERLDRLEGVLDAQ